MQMKGERVPNMKLDISKIGAGQWVTLASMVLSVVGIIIDSKQRTDDNHEIAVEVARILTEKMNERIDA